MINVLITPDISSWAIGNLTRSIERHNSDRFKFHIIPVHPRGVAEGLSKIKLLMKKTRIDLWHAQYWNSAIQLYDVMPELRKIPKVLSHHNHYALREKSWDMFESVVIPTDFGFNILRENHKNVFKIPYGIDLDEFTYIDKLTEEKNIGYIGRVVKWKNLKPICEVAKKLGVRVVGSGYIDDKGYWQSIDRSNLEYYGGLGRDNMNEWQNKNKLYEKMLIFVAYSTGERETGTLPLLEAMARGIPVLTTNQGMARDFIQDRVNGIIFNEENFEERLKMLLGGKELRERIRQKAWRTVKNLTEQRMARNYAKVYYDTLFRGQKLISIIIPTCNRPEQLLESLCRIEKQNYKAKEVLVCDDGNDPRINMVISECKKKFTFPLIYLKTEMGDKYGLAKARNMGAIEALGEILVFLDDRLALKGDDCLDKIAKTIGANDNWYYGAKRINGQTILKNSFMENFSWIRKTDFVKGGMFCEEMTYYGGLSEETRKRYGLLNYSFRGIESIEVDEMINSARNKKKEQIWRAKDLINKMYGA